VTSPHVFIRSPQQNGQLGRSGPSVLSHVEVESVCDQDSVKDTDFVPECRKIQTILPQTNKLFSLLATCSRVNHGRSGLHGVHARTLPLVRPSPAEVEPRKEVGAAGVLVKTEKYMDIMRQAARVHLHKTKPVICRGVLNGCLGDSGLPVL
jgi:hypothetical protein